MKKVKSGVFQRGLALAKLTAKSGVLAASSLTKNREEYLIEQMKLLSEELGLLKGSLMKVGQTLSMYGEHFLPPKANEYLKNLQVNSPPIAWESVQEFLQEELGQDQLEKLNIEKTALAAASLGQVHRATLLETGEQLAIKIQYPGVEAAIKSDLKAIKTILSVSQILPRSLNTDQFFDEIATMLTQETNYKLEKVWTQQMHGILKNDPRFVVPKVYGDFCSKHILTTSYEPGLMADSPEVQSLPQERRNQLALNYLDLYFKELFVFKLVQTDPHLGNYKIRLAHPDSESQQDQIILYDFGAMREVPDHFGEPFKKLVQGAALKDKELVFESAYTLGYLDPADPPRLKEDYYQVCCLIGEPFAENPEYPFTDAHGNYDWRNTDLPKRASQAARKIVTSYKLRIPPRESVFLDRKLAGAFIFTSVLGLNGKARSELVKYFN